MSMRIGIDLGGTKTEVIALAKDGEELFRHRVLTPRENYEAMLELIGSLVDEAEQSCGMKGTVGIGTPGAISPATGLIKNANSVWLNGKPLEQDLVAALGRPVRLANDADCFTLSEATDGAAQGAANVFGVIIGTGTGGGLVINGQLLKGPNAIAGEWGHNPMPWPRWDERRGAPCYCGKRGCIETYLSGAGLSRDHYDLTRQRLTAAELAQRCCKGDHLAEQTMARYEDRLARALAAVINVVDPDVIVLGGGVSNITSLYQRVPKLWGQYVFSDTVATHLLPARFGDSSGVRGAAWLWPVE
ncbi:MAG TPA: ROK family protein [Candidatus Tenderia electrophaga]|uniref:ROK family protein n=1 Tax=Candidatus Tenderia electrophaga TaxID=1748243 RepID=A0A832J654_9GAMM|nr:ROK family protein [Candidatus Tenderia electrophaga]